MKTATKKALLLFAFLFFLKLTALSQNYSAEKFQVSTARVSKRVVIKYASRLHSLSIVVEGNKIVPLSSEGKQHYLSVDNNLLQYLLVPPIEKVGYDSFNKKSKEDFLLQYENYEMGFIKSKFKLGDLNEKLHFAYLNGRLFLTWYFDMPKNIKM